MEHFTNLQVILVYVRSSGKESACKAGDAGLIPGVRDDFLEEEMATHSSILAWRTPWTEEFGALYSPWGCKESDTTKAT